MSRLKYPVILTLFICSFALLYATCLCAKPYAALKENVFRLHIVANSDSDADQALKLAVRDALIPIANKAFLDLEHSDFPGNTPAQQTASAACGMIDAFTLAANETVAAWGSAQKVDVKVAYAHFPPKSYEDITMPAGDYWCLKVVLGEGKGQNWWCVLYPPLCITPAGEEAYFEPSSLEILYKPQQYRFRLAFLDWMKRLQDQHRK